MQFRIETIMLVLLPVAALAPGLRAQNGASREPIARIEGQPVYDDDLLPSIGGQLFHLKTQEYELKGRELIKLANQRVVESAAKSKGLSMEAFLQETVDRTLPPPTPGEVEAYYLAQKDQLNRPFSEVRPQMEHGLMQARRQQARERYLDQLREKAALEILLKPPRVEVAPDLSRLRGSPDAPVTIVEFSDYQCPYCRAVESSVKEVLEKYKTEVRFSYRDFPLKRIHPLAEQAAEAARCAGEQGKFWEYHDLLYANQPNLDQAGLTEHARTLGLQLDPFSACLASGKFKAAIDRDLQAGLRAGVSGTPAFYINGVFLSGVQPVSAFEEIIRTELQAAKSKPAGK